VLDAVIAASLDVQTFHRGADELPFFPLGDGSSLRLVHVDLASNLWIAPQRFEPGTQVLRHRHTGPVHVSTTAGAWKYLEYDDVNRAGSRERSTDGGQSQPREGRRPAAVQILGH
jgi:ChrR-like protein with cupin domain